MTFQALLVAVIAVLPGVVCDQAIAQATYQGDGLIPAS
jgi:hypothetical protein